MVVFVHTSQLYFIECDYPRAFVVMISSNALVFLGLFGNFYRKTYTISKKFAKSITGVGHSAEVETSKKAIKAE